MLALESRRANEIAKLIQNQQGEPIVAPSMRERPLEQNDSAFEFAERLFAGEFDMVIFLTGVGARALQKVLAARCPEDRFFDALRGVAIVARGPKPAAVLREWQVPIHVLVPEPNTWREVLEATAERPERRIAVQEYGKSNSDLLDALRARGAEVTSVRVYQWDLPEDTGPLREAVRRTAAGEVDIAMFTTSLQVVHLFRIAEEEGLAEAVRRNLARAVIASIGPTTSEMLEEYGLPADLMPSHPKMGFLVKETAEQARAILDRKRAQRHAADTA